MDTFAMVIGYIVMICAALMALASVIIGVIDYSYDVGKNTVLFYCFYCKKGDLKEAYELGKRDALRGE